MKKLQEIEKQKELERKKQFELEKSQFAQKTQEEIDRIKEKERKDELKRQEEYKKMEKELEDKRKQIEQEKKELEKKQKEEEKISFMQPLISLKTPKTSTENTVLTQPPLPEEVTSGYDDPLQDQPKKVFSRKPKPSSVNIMKFKPVLEEAKKKVAEVNSWQITNGIITDLESDFSDKTGSDMANLSPEAQRIEFMRNYWTAVEGETPSVSDLNEAVNQIFNYRNKHHIFYTKMLFKFPKLRKVYLDKLERYEQGKTEMLNDVLNDVISDLQFEHGASKDEIDQSLKFLGYGDMQRKMPQISKGVKKIFPSLYVKFYTVLLDILQEKPCKDSKMKKGDFQIKARIERLIEELELVLFENGEEALKNILGFVDKEKISEKRDYYGIIEDVKKEFLKTGNDCKREEKEKEFYQIGYYDNVEFKEVKDLDESLRRFEKIEGWLKQFRFYLDDHIKQGKMKQINPVMKILKDVKKKLLSFHR